MKVAIIPTVIGDFSTVTRGLLKGLEDLEVGARAESIQTTALLINGQNTEKSPADLIRLAVTQTPLKDHQLMLMRKTLIIIIIRIDETQQNSKCRLCGDRDETINHIISNAAN